MEAGIVYVATGTAYRDECQISAASVREHMPDVPITLFSDEAVTGNNFDSVHVLSDPSYDSSDVIECLLQTPYDRTIFLDTDIYIDGDISELFDMMDSFDVGVVIDPTHTCPRDSPVPIVPSTFPEYNTGMIAYRSNPQTDSLLSSWRSLYEYHNSPADQPSFRDSVYLSDVRLLTLPPEYNCLYGPYPGYAYGKIKVFHGRLIDEEGFSGLSYDRDPAAARDVLNSSHYARAYSWNGQFKLHQNRKGSGVLTEQFIDSVRTEGWLETSRKTAKYLAARVHRRTVSSHEG